MPKKHRTIFQKKLDAEYQAYRDKKMTPQSREEWLEDYVEELQNRSIVYVLVCFDGESELVFVSRDSDKPYQKAFEFYQRYPDVLEFTPEAFQQIMALEIGNWADRFEELKHRSGLLSSTLYQEEL